jgi:hypothetical protein
MFEASLNPRGFSVRLEHVLLSSKPGSRDLSAVSFGRASSVGGRKHPIRWSRAGISISNQHPLGRVFTV